MGDNTTKSYSFTGGGQIGYNWQRGALVWGIEADMNYLGNSKTDNNDIDYGGSNLPYAQIRSKIDALGTVRGRMGLAVDSALIYVTAGFAEGHSSDSYFDVADAATGRYAVNPLWQSNGWKPGFAVGMGVEYLVAPNWSVKVEGLYYNLAEKTVQINSIYGGGDPYSPRESFSNQGALVRVGLNYHFDLMAPAAPVVAKY